MVGTKRTREGKEAKAASSSSKKQKTTSSKTDQKKNGEESKISIHEYDQNTEYKFISWNVNGFKALMQKQNGLYITKLVEEEKPSAIFLQETKLSDSQTSGFNKILKGYTPHFNNCAAKKGYSGTAVYIRNEGPQPKSIKFERICDENEGRNVVVEYEDVYVVGTYVPNSGQKLDRLEWRTQKWDPAMLAYLKKLEESKPVIWCGDLNVAILDIDIHDPKRNKRSAGFTDEERAEFRKVLAHFCDSFRHFHPDEQNQYTYWGYRFNMREKDKGWRLDYFVVSKSLVSKLKDSYILKSVIGSDHCPVGIVLTKPSTPGDNTTTDSADTIAKGNDTTSNDNSEHDDVKVVENIEKSIAEKDGDSEEPGDQKEVTTQ